MTHRAGGGAKQPKTLAAWHPCADSAAFPSSSSCFHRLPRMEFDNLRQAKAAIRLWIKTAKEDVLEIPPPSRTLGLCVIATRHPTRAAPPFCILTSAL